jgi:hypothetical protein
MNEQDKLNLQQEGDYELRERTRMDNLDALEEMRSSRGGEAYIDHKLRNLMACELMAKGIKK